MELFVQYEQTCDESHRSDEQWGDWYESNTFTVRGVSVSTRDRWNEEKFAVGFDVKPGEAVFVLYMIYSTGDTFGRAEGCGEVLWVFKDPDTAREALRLWREENDKRDPEYSVKFKDETGRVIQLSNPGAGYFENVSTIDLETFLVNP